MGLTKKGRLLGHFSSRALGTSQHAFNTEVLSPDNSSQQALSNESSGNELSQKERILILANGSKEPPINSKRSCKTITTKEYYEFGEYTFAINSKKSGCYTQILKALIAQTLVMQSIYKRVLFMRFDLHLGASMPDNKCITKMLKRLRKRLIYRYGQTSFGYVWVREESNNENLHYHFVFMMDGDVIRYPINVHEQVKKIWTDMGGTFHFANHHFIDSEEKLHEAILHGSYLAKTRSKGNRPAQTKDYGASRLKIDVL